MSLSQNIKRLRLEKNMTQEQLASSLGISAQAVSKWETSETYPDGSLLVPLAQELEVSLDELFDNTSVSMSDISKRIMRLINKVSESERLHVARDIGWQIERGLFNCRMTIEEKYSPDEIKNQHNASYILNDYGFTFISNGKEPFFSVFPEPDDGFGNFLDDIEELQKIFSVLSSPDTVRALIYLYRHNENYVFESAVLARECDIEDDAIDKVMQDLLSLKIVWEKEIAFNGENRVLYYSRPNHKLIALFIIARELGYKGAYSLQGHHRTKPFLK